MYRDRAQNAQQKMKLLKSETKMQKIAAIINPEFNTAVNMLPTLIIFPKNKLVWNWLESEYVAENSQMFPIFP